MAQRHGNLVAGHRAELPSQAEVTVAHSCCSAMRLQLPLLLHRITRASRASAARPQPLLTRGRVILMYRITAHYPMSVTV
jgi:hypothetical protein